MTSDAHDFLMGGAPTANFLTVGTVHQGRIRSYEKTQQRDMDSGLPKTWDNGEPMWQIVFTIETDERDPSKPHDDGVRRIFAKANMLNAIRDAIRKSGHDGNLVGGTLAVKYSGDDTPKKKGFNPPKLYEARFTPPTETQSFNDMAQAAAGPAQSTAASGGWDDEEPF